MKARFLLMIILAALLSIVATRACAYTEEGYASWYGGKFQGRLTANGEKFDTNDLTAAHKTLPFNSVVRVINIVTSESVEVRINDRGPFVEGRIIDLSRAAADKIGITGLGVAMVRLELVLENDGDNLSKIQVAAYSSMDNAVKTKRKLEYAGLGPSIETGEDGFHRIVLNHITEKNLSKTIDLLKNSGFPHIIIK
jgi:rare lipoprotein A